MRFHIVDSQATCWLPKISLLAALLARRIACMKSNYQRGTIYEASGSFFVRYFEKVDGVKKRVSHKLCDRDETHYSITCDAVLALRDEHMVTTRKPKPQPSTDTLITEYWENTYLPTVKAGLKPSTVDGYQANLEAVSQKTTSPVAPSASMNHTTATSCSTRRLLRSTVGAPLPTFAAWPSGIFTHACNDGLLLNNPWRNVKTKIKPPKPKDTSRLHAHRVDGHR